MTTHHTDDKPRKNEDEYFARQNAELINQMRAKLDADRQATQRQEHFMKCPKCGGDLKEIEHHQVKVDQCVDCRGVWLDAGEVELFEHASDSGVTRFFSSMFRRRTA